METNGLESCLFTKIAANDVQLDNFKQIIWYLEKQFRAFALHFAYMKECDVKAIERLNTTLKSWREIPEEQRLAMIETYPYLEIKDSFSFYLYDPTFKRSKKQKYVVFSLHHSRNSAFCFNDDQEFDLDIHLFKNPIFIKQIKRLLATRIKIDTVRTERNSIYWTIRTLHIIEKYLVQKICFSFKSLYSQKMYTQHELTNYLEDTKSD